MAGAGDGAGRPLAGSGVWVSVVRAPAGCGEGCGLTMAYRSRAVSDCLDGNSVGGFKFEVQRVDGARRQRVEVEICLHGTSGRRSYAHGY